MSDQSNFNGSILFVCMGNICRSPAAESVFAGYLERNGHRVPIHVDSAGTHGYQTGAAADSRMRRAAKKRGFELTSRARQIGRQDLETFDLVIVMDLENLAIVNSLAASPAADVKLLSDFLDSRWPREVPDPYYGGRRGFETVLDMLEAACPNILQHLRHTAN